MLFVNKIPTLAYIKSKMAQIESKSRNSVKCTKYEFQESTINYQILLNQIQSTFSESNFKT